MKRKIFLSVLLLLSLQVLSLAQERILQKDNIYFLSHTVIVKMKDAVAPANALSVKETLNNKLKQMRVQEAKQTFASSHQTLNKGEERLSKIFTLTIDNQSDPIEAAKKISKLKEVEWAEPKYVHRLTYEPNDSLFVLDRQKNLERIFAKEAWNITKGDTSIIIGIVDTGVDCGHPDLSANILKDQQGKVIGYDFGGMNGTPDSNPAEDFSNKNAYHGTHVAGIASAVTDNSIGIASIGFKCKILPVKTSRNDLRDAQSYPYVVYGYEGIIYAADMGAKVINCSWGGEGYSRFEQEIIDYAVSKGALVVASAGNEGSRNLFYPASYKGVLSVGWLNTFDDTKSFAANYGGTVNVMAPGSLILSTWQRDSNQNQLYNNLLSGSSMASPLVAGLAGLVFSKFPNYTPLQVAERIRVTCDDVDSYNPDSLKLLLGRGRINAFKALNESNIVSVRATDVKFIDEGNHNGLLESGESASIELTFTNYLNSVSNVAVRIESSDPAVVISGNSFLISSLDTLRTTTNASNKFRFIVAQNAPINHNVDFLLRYSSGNYSDFQWLTARINPTYSTHNINKITLSVTSKGALGFNDYPNNLEGEGFKFLGGENMMFEGALMYGICSNKLMDAARETNTQSTDFKTITPIKIVSPGSLADQEGSTVFNDEGAGALRLGLSTMMYTYAFSSPPDDKYIILQTAFHNSTAGDINNLYVGYLFDFDMPTDDYQDDTTGYDPTDNFAFAFDKDGIPENTFVGVALISSGGYGYYGIDNTATTGSVIFNDGFSDSEKWYALSNGISKPAAGVGDISFVLSGGPFSIPADSTKSVAFALAAGASLNEVRTAIKQSRIKYQSITTSVREEKNVIPREFVLYQNYPNPFNPTTTIKFQVSGFRFVSLKIFDVLGREVATLVDGELNHGEHSVVYDAKGLTSGVYFYQLRAAGFIQTKKMVLIK